MFHIDQVRPELPASNNEIGRNTAAGDNEHLFAARFRHLITATRRNGKSKNVLKPGSAYLGTSSK